MGVSSVCPYIIDVNDIICTSVLIQMGHFSDVSEVCSIDGLMTITQKLFC